jgi:carbon storage regulator
MKSAESRHSEWSPEMLVLTRKLGQKIFIPSINAVIEVVEIKGNTVRLGISAPREVSIVREELLDRMRAEDEQEALAQA